LLQISQLDNLGDRGGKKIFFVDARGVLRKYTLKIAGNKKAAQCSFFMKGKNQSTTHNHEPLIHQPRPQLAQTCLNTAHVFRAYNSTPVGRLQTILVNKAPYIAGLDKLNETSTYLIA